MKLTVLTPCYDDSDKYLESSNGFPKIFRTDKLFTKSTYQGLSVSSVETGSGIGISHPPSQESNTGAVPSDHGVKKSAVKVRQLEYSAQSFITIETG